MEMTQVLPGCVHVREQSAAALFGAPPEVLKHILKRELPVPTTVVLPDVAYRGGASQIALEFLTYWHLFFDELSQTSCPPDPFRIIGSPADCERVAQTLQVTLFGPTRAQMKRWKLSKSRTAMLARMMDYMTIRDDVGRPVQMADIITFVHYDKITASAPLLADGQLTVSRLGNNRFQITDGGTVTEQVDLNFEGPQKPVSLAPDPLPETPQVLRVKLLGTYSGFDVEGPTTGLVLWVNGNGFLVDGPAGTADYLRQMGVSKADLAGVILSHVHDDHCTLMDLILSEQTTNIISTREIYESMLIKVSAVLGESIDAIRGMLRFTEVVPGKMLRMYGATWSFFYTVHSIPTIGFRVTVQDSEGQPHSFVHSSDTADFALLDEMVAAGAIGRAHAQRMKRLADGVSDLVMIDGGGPPIHGNPADFEQAMAEHPETDFLFYHVNPKNVDTDRFPVGHPGWGKTYLPASELPQPLVLKLLRTMKLLEVDDLFWMNVVFSQGRLVQVQAGSEVVAKGKQGDHFYFVLSGSALVSDRNGDTVLELARLESGDFFGEMSIIQNANRNASVVASSPLLLFRLPGDIFLEFVEANNLKERFERLWLSRRLISNVRLFRNLRPHARHELSMKAEPVSFEEGDQILKQGAKSDDFYIITSGKVAVKRRRAGSVEVTDTLESGDFFGENVAMGYSSRRNASVVAVTMTEALRIPGSELRRLARTVPILTHELHLVMRERGMTQIPCLTRESKP